MPRNCSVKAQRRILDVPFTKPTGETLSSNTTVCACGAAIKGGRKFCSIACYRVSQRSTPLASRFWPRVNKTTSCWLWTGTINVGNGYGQLGISGQSPAYAHRLAWEFANGPIPIGQSVPHACDVPTCVNPAHLFLGTHTDNMRDASRKGRLNVPRPGGQRVTDAQVSQIRQMVASGSTQREAALAVGVSTAFVSLLLSGQRRQHVKVPA